jgi:hypothetical protein
MCYYIRSVAGIVSFGFVACGDFQLHTRLIMNTTNTSSFFDPNFLNEVWRAIVALWKSGNYCTMIALRVVACVTVGTPFFLMAIAATELGWLVALAALFLLGGGIIMLTFFPYPLLVPAAAKFFPDETRIVWRTVTEIVGFELLIAFFFATSFFSPKSRVEYLPMILLGTVATVSFLWLKWQTRAALTGITTAFLILMLKLGGFGAIGAWWKKLGDEITGKTPVVQVAPPQQFIVHSGNGYCNQLPAGLRMATIIVDTQNGQSPLLTPPPGMDRILNVSVTNSFTSPPVDVQVQLFSANGGVYNPFWINPVKRMGPPMGQMTAIRLYAPKRAVVNVTFGNGSLSSQRNGQGRGFVLRNPPGY